jgi:two-component system, OmpR family, sensor histidine kinase KdpD
MVRGKLVASKKHMRASGLKSTLRHMAIGAAAVALLTAAAFRTHLNLASVIPLYLFVIVLESLTGDFLSSLLIAAVSAGCLDFFFTEPIFSLYIGNPRSVLALLAFAFTSLVITKLVSQFRREAFSASTQRERLDRLYQLSHELMHLEPDAATSGQRLLDPFRRIFGVTAICFFEAETMQMRAWGDAETLANQTRDAYIRGVDLDEHGSATSVRCLRMGGHLSGAIGFQGMKEPAETSSALAALTATFLERTKAFHDASASAAAAQAEVYRSAILDALAHEFKTPLATILAAAGGIREAGPLEPAQMEMADTVESEATRLGNLASRLLRTARLEQQDIRPRMELTDLGALIGRIARQYAERWADRRIVTPGSGTVEALADAELLRLAIGQILENACKYSAPGSTVAIRMDRLPDAVVIRIANDGSNIRPSERQRIFERFYRGSDARRSTSGSGLGLYVARKIATAHGGALDLESNEAGDGRVAFLMKLPAAKPEVEAHDELNPVVTAE